MPNTQQISHFDRKKSLVFLLFSRSNQVSKILTRCASRIRFSFENPIQWYQKPNTRLLLEGARTCFARHGFHFRHRRQNGILQFSIVCWWVVSHKNNPCSRIFQSIFNLFFLMKENLKGYLQSKLHENWLNNKRVVAILVIPFSWPMANCCFHRSRKTSVDGNPHYERTIPPRSMKNLHKVPGVFPQVV